MAQAKKTKKPSKSVPAPVPAQPVKQVEIVLRLHPKQRMAYSTQANEVLFGGAAGGGKAGPYGAEIITPFGVRRMGDLAVGDVISNPNGEPQQVIAIHEQGEKECVRLLFDDGTSAECTLDHLWLIHQTQRRRKCASYHESEFKGEVWTTREIIAHLDGPKFRRSSSISIPLCAPIKFTKSYKVNCRPLPPYLLGVLLGDGSLTGATPVLACADTEIVARLAELGYVPKQGKRKIIYSFPGQPQIRRFLEKAKLRCRAEHKFIPEHYLLAPVEERWELARGLMDTDGYVDERGHMEFCSVSNQLAQNVAFLCRSLGAKVSVSEKSGSYRKDGRRVECQKVYRLHMQSEDNSRFFFLPRKKSRASVKWNAGNGKPRRRIIAYEEIGPRRCRCITVRHPNGLYLTNDFIVTHNSFLMRAAAILWCSQIPGLCVYIFRRLLPDLVKNHMEGPKGFRSLLAPWVNHNLVKIVEDEIRFLWNGSKIFLCHCQDDADRFKYQGSEMHVLLVDELTSFSECIYTFLRSRVRMSGVELPAQFHGLFPRILCSSNPGGEGHEWVKRYWVDPVPPMEFQRMPSFEGGMLRQFIPSRLDDNPSLREDDPYYEDKLSGLGSPAMVKAYRDGDWNVIAGAFFPEFGNEHVVKPFKVPHHWTRFVSFDWGSYDPFCVQWWAIASEDFEVPDGSGKILPRDSMICYREWYGADQRRMGLKMTIEEISRGIKDREEVGERIDYRVAGKDVFDVKGGPSFAERFMRKGLVFRRASITRIPGWDQVRQRLVGTMGAPLLYVFDTCRDLIRTLPTLQHDDKKPNDMAKGDDHCADSCRYACMSRPYAAKTPESPSELQGYGMITLDQLWKFHETKSLRRRRR